MFRSALAIFALLMTGAALVSGCNAQPVGDASADPSAKTDEETGQAVDQTAVEIDHLLEEMIDAARQGDYVQAEDLRTEAYLEFEEGLELQLVRRDPELKEEIDNLFGMGSKDEPGLAALIASQAPADEIGARAANIKEEMEEVQHLLGMTMTGPLAVLTSMTIILREGLEAVLIIGAVLGYLRATRRDGQHQRWVYAGILIGIILSVLTYWASLSLIAITAANRELLEGITSLLAVVVLFFVTNWLFHRVYVVGWMSFIKDEVGKSLQTGSLAGLAFLSFTVVYREGFETVLFYQALRFDANPAMVLIGFILGVAIIIGIAYAILRLSVQIPVKPLFAVTGIVLLVLAVRFSGLGVHELQEAGAVGTTLLAGLPAGGIPANILGFFPTVETLAAQLILLTCVAATFGISRWQRARQATSEAQSTN